MTFQEFKRQIKLNYQNDLGLLASWYEQVQAAWHITGLILFPIALIFGAWSLLCLAVLLMPWSVNAFLSAVSFTTAVAKSSYAWALEVTAPLRTKLTAAFSEFKAGCTAAWTKLVQRLSSSYDSNPGAYPAPAPSAVAAAAEARAGVGGSGGSVDAALSSGSDSVSGADDTATDHPAVGEPSAQRPQ